MLRGLPNSNQHLPVDVGQTFWSPTILYRQPYFAGFVGMENCIFSLCLDVRNFLKLLKKTCLHKGGFPDFLTFTFPFGHLAVRQWNFFQVRRGLRTSAHLKKISLSHRQMSAGKSSCQKNPENHLYVGASFSTLQEIFTSAEREKNRPVPFSIFSIED